MSAVRCELLGRADCAGRILLGKDPAGGVQGGGVNERPLLAGIAGVELVGDFEDGRL